MNQFSRGWGDYGEIVVFLVEKFVFLMRMTVYSFSFNFARYSLGESPRDDLKTLEK